MIRKLKVTSGIPQENSFIAVPRVKLYVPKEESFLVPIKYIDVTRTSCTSLDVMLEKQIEDHWNVDGKKELSDAWTGFTRFDLLKERPPEGFSWSGWRLTRKQKTSRPDDGQICGNLCPTQQRRKQNKDGLSRNQSSTMPDNWEEYSLLNQTMKNSSSQWKPPGESWMFRWQPQCFAKYRYGAVEKPSAILGNARQNTLVLLMPTKARDQRQKELDTNLTKNTSLQKGWILWLTTVSFANSFRCLN